MTSIKRLSQIHKQFSFMQGYIFRYNFLVENKFNLPDDETLNFRQITAEDFSRDAVFKEKGRENRYLKHIVNGHECYGYVAPNGEVASYIWVSTDNKTPWGKRFQLTSDSSSAYIWDCRTCEKFYRKGLYYRGLLKVCDWLKNDKNIQNVFITCDSKNSPSKAGILKAGFELLESFSIVNLPFFSLVFFKVTKRFSMRFRNSEFKLSDFYKAEN